MAHTIKIFEKKIELFYPIYFRSKILIVPEPTIRYFSDRQNDVKTINRILRFTNT